MSELRISLPRPCSESWEAMRPDGCNRYCATCSETIHDLSRLTAHEAADLLRAPGKHCVRAEIKPDGAVVLRPSSSGGSHKILAAVGASMGLLTAACQTAPQAPVPKGSIVGKVDRLSFVDSVLAVSDDGRTYRTRVLNDGSFRFKPLPYGRYKLTFFNWCESLDGGQIVLQQGEQSVEAPPNSPSARDCIVLGMATIEEDRG